jgi:RNA polymerase sigma factor (sigma-70 family)
MDISYKDELALIQGCINNERKAQEILYKAFFGKMFTMCMRYTSDQDLICAIINDAFLSVFKNISKYENRGVLEGWIRRITFNTLADHFRKENKQIKFLLIDEYHNAPIGENKLSETYDYDDIIAKINTLPGNFKDVFVKYAIEGYNHREIGEELQISEGTSKWYLFEARKKLQALFKISNTTIKYGR